MVVKTGVKKDGTLVARQVKAFWNGGAYGAMKPIPSVNLPGAVKAAGSYRIPNVKIDSYAVYTNSVPCGHFRSPGMVQLVFAGESQMDMIAKALKIDPMQISRLRNALRDGDPPRVRAAAAWSTSIAGSARGCGRGFPLEDV